MSQSTPTISTFQLERNFDSIQDAVMIKKPLLNPGTEININSRVFSVNLYSSDNKEDEEEQLNDHVVDDQVVEKILCKDHLFGIDYLLHADECREILEKENSIGFESISSEYPQEYRNSKRIVYNDKEFANRLWRRLKKFMVDCNFMKPYGLDSDGSWIPIGVNECMRLSRYESGNYFKPHTDAQFLRNDQERSIYTLLIYLNDGFKGGETEFLHRVDESEEFVTKFKNICTVQPRMGCATVFNHELYHQGCVVTSGVKYILRTEIMFKRIDSTEQLVSKRNDLLHHQIMNLLSTSDDLEKKGELKDSTYYYRKAQELLIQYGHSTSFLMIPTFSKSKYSENYSLVSNLSQIPDELLIHIFKYLQDWEICQLILPLDRFFNFIGRKPEVWEWKYMQKWGHSITNLLKQFQKSIADDLNNFNTQDNTSSLEDTPTEEQDWFHVYIMKRYFEKEFEPVFVDFGSSITANTHYSAIDGVIKITATKAMRPPVTHYSFPKFSTYELFEDKTSGLNMRSMVLHKGNNFTKYVQVFTGLLYKKLNKSLPRNPLVVSLHSNGMVEYESVKDTLLKFMFMIKIPAVCILPRCYLLSIYYNLPTCLVVDIGTYEAHAHAVIKGDKEKIETVQTIHDSDQMIIVNQFENAKSKEEILKCFKNCCITSSIDRIIERYPNEVRNELLDNIIFSGECMEKKEKDQILNMFNSPYSKYRVKYHTNGEEAIMAAISFSKLPNFRDYCTFWFDCEQIIDYHDRFV